MPAQDIAGTGLVTGRTGETVDFLSGLGSVAGVCTTVAFVPQILKIHKQGGRDLSYPMLALYLMGVLLWLWYGFLLHATAVIWANGITALLIVVAIVLKAGHVENPGA